MPASHDFENDVNKDSQMEVDTNVFEDNNFKDMDLFTNKIGKQIIECKADVDLASKQGEMVIIYTLSTVYNIVNKANDLN
jgi:hypothetical protein